MQRPLKHLLCALLPLALVACETAVPPPQATPGAAAPAPAPPPAPQAEAVPAPAATPVADATPGALPAGISREIQPLSTIGVVACDSYVEAVRACLNGGSITGRERLKVRAELSRQVDAWRAEGKQPAIETCITARTEARGKLKQYGCSSI